MQEMNFEQRIEYCKEKLKPLDYTKIVDYNVQPSRIHKMCDYRFKYTPQDLVTNLVNYLKEDQKFEKDIIEFLLEELEAKNSIIPPSRLYAYLPKVILYIKSLPIIYHIILLNYSDLHKHDLNITKFPKDMIEDLVNAL